MAPQPPGFTPEHLEQLEAATRRSFWLHAAALYALAIALAAFTFLLYPSHASAELRLEALGGRCEQNRTEEGSWWNDHYETNLQLRTGCYQLGISAAPWTWRGNSFGWRLAYVDFGSISTNSVMALRDEDQFKYPDGSRCNTTTGEDCLIRTVGGGRAQGISLGLIVERAMRGRYFATQDHVTIGAEAGLFVYYNHWTVEVTAHPDPSVSLMGDFVPMRWDQARGWLVTPYAGVNLRYHWLLVSMRTYASIMAQGKCDYCAGVTKHHAFQFNAGISVPF